MKNELVNSGDVVAVTFDLWVDISLHGFIAITAHKINKEFELSPFTLDVIDIEGKHTGYAIYELIDVSRMDDCSICC